MPEGGDLIIQHIYDAALEPSRWPAVLAEVAAALDAGLALLCGLDRRRNQVTFQWSSRAAQAGAPANPDDEAWDRLALGLLDDPTPVSEAVPSVADEEQDLLPPLSLAGVQHSMASVVLRRGSLAIVLTLCSSRGPAPFAERTQGLLRLFLPHLRQALEVQLRLARAERQRDTTLECLDRMRLAVLVVDDEARVSFANRSARVILDAGDGLAWRDGRVVPPDPGDRRALRQLLERATTAGASSEDGNALTISRSSDKRPLELLACPIRCALAEESPVHQVVLFIGDVDQEIEGHRQTLQAIYGLTPSEARVALAVCQGRGLQEAADALGVGLNTVRTHVHHVYQKTGTTRQAELAQMLLRGPLQVSLD